MKMDGTIASLERSEQILRTVGKWEFHFLIIKPWKHLCTFRFPVLSQLIIRSRRLGNSTRGKFHNNTFNTRQGSIESFQSVTVYISLWCFCIKTALLHQGRRRLRLVIRLWYHGAHGAERNTDDHACHNKRPCPPVCTCCKRSRNTAQAERGWAKPAEKRFLKSLELVLSLIFKKK